MYCGLDAGELRRLKQLADENRELKQLVANLILDKYILQHVLSKTLTPKRRRELVAHVQASPKPHLQPR